MAGDGTHLTDTFIPRAKAIAANLFVRDRHIVKLVEIATSCTQTRNTLGSRARQSRTKRSMLQYVLRSRARSDLAETTSEAGPAFL